MNTWLDPLVTFVSWLARNSLQACLLVGLILVLQSVLRDRISPRWRYALWLILVIKLALPWSPPSRVSVYNVLAVTSHPAFGGAPAEMQDDAADLALSADSTITSPGTSAAPLAAAPAAGTDVATGARIAWWPLLLRALPLIWLVGACVLALLTAIQARRLASVRRERFVTDQATLELLEDCKQQMNVPAYLAVIETSQVAGPALFGFLRPRLLLPSGAIASLGPVRLRHVFLHELAHLKRHDITVNWLLAILQILHWFNPLVWYAFGRMRNERELACDALALSHSGAPDPSDYGRTIVDMLDTFIQPHRQPGLAGVLEDKTQLKRRITMIAQFHRNARQGTVLATALLLVLGCIALAGPTASQPAVSLNEGQQLYADWTEKTFGDFLDTKQYEGLSDSSKAELETRWIAALSGEKNTPYYQAINNLAGIRSTKAVAPLLKIAADRAEKDNRDRWMAARALGLIGETSAVPELIHLTYHYNQNTRFWAQISLVRLTGQNFGTDWQAWAVWWNGQGKQPAASIQPITWTTRSEYGDPAKQKEADAQMVARLKQPGGAQAPKASAAEATGADGSVRQALRTKFELRMRQDLQKYSREQIAEAEKLYQVANKNWGSPEARTSLEQMIAQYPDLNRTGCAVLYMAQMARGAEQKELLQQAIDQYGDCMYGDGVQIGAYARFYLAELYDAAGKKEQARAIYEEIGKLFPIAINHKGVPLAQLIEASHPTKQPAGAAAQGNR